MDNRSGSDPSVFLFGKEKDSPEFRYTSPPFRRVAGSKRAASASKRAPVALKETLPNGEMNVGASTAENLMAALVLSDVAPLESKSGSSPASVGRTQSEIHIPPHPVCGHKTQAGLNKSEVSSKVVDWEIAGKHLPTSPSLVQPSQDRKIKPLPHPKYSKAVSLSSSESSDSEVPEVHETNPERFTAPVVYRRKTYYSDDELSWGDNSDIDNEDSLAFDTAPRHGSK